MRRIGKTARAGFLPAAAVIVVVVAAAAVAVAALVPTPGPAAEVRAQGDLAAPADVSARNGANTGEVVVSWTPAAGADRNRVGWANLDEVRMARAAGDWRAAFNFVDLRAGRSEHTIRRLSPEAWHAFIVATRAAGGAVIYSDWVYVRTAAQTPTPTPTPTIALPQVKATRFAPEPTVVISESPRRDYYFPAWSPDGSRIAFMSDGIYVMNADGSGATRLTDDDDIYGRFPAWSPDSRRIAFVTYEAPDYDFSNIYIANADGSGIARITDNDYFYSYLTPAWSPDGERMAFASCPGYCDDSSEIYVMNADGSDITRLTYQTGYNVLPAWSPDGSRIAFKSLRLEDDEFDEVADCACNTYVMNADGSEVKLLTEDPDVTGPVAWSPDGRRMAFQARWVGGIIVMNVDGSGKTLLVLARPDIRLTASGFKFSPFAWSPDGRLAFADYVAIHTIDVPPQGRGR